MSFEGRQYYGASYASLKCANCGRGGMATIWSNSGNFPHLAEFYPASIERAKLPDAVPADILSEFREAELCMAHGAYRAASALLRSCLEKVLLAHGYNERTLYAKIEAAAKDVILTETQRRRAQDEVKVLGNDVLHDPWREVDAAECELSHHYTQRILEAFYDHPEVVRAELEKLRDNPPPIAGRSG